MCVTSIRKSAVLQARALRELDRGKHFVVRLVTLGQHGHIPRSVGELAGALVVLGPYDDGGLGNGHLNGRFSFRALDYREPYLGRAGDELKLAPIHRQTLEPGHDRGSFNRVVLVELNRRAVLPVTCRRHRHGKVLRQFFGKLQLYLPRNIVRLSGSHT